MFLTAKTRVKIRNNSSLILEKDLFNNSVLLIDKPAGITSSEVIVRLKRLTGVSKIGHSGTLDKFASGLLVVSTGMATKLSRFFLEHDKTYIGKVKLGIATDTDDSAGNVLSENSVTGLNEADIQNVLLKFAGEIYQKPPDYSALKINGRRASDIVRNGEGVQLSERPVTIHEISVSNFNLAGNEFDVRVKCSKGTYIRALARDIGIELGVGAHLKALRRLESGPFSIEYAADFSDLDKYISGERRDVSFIIKPEDALKEFSSMVLNDDALNRVLNGAAFNREDIISEIDGDKKIFMLMDCRKNLIAMADIDMDKWQIKYLNVFRDIH